MFSNLKKVIKNINKMFKVFLLQSLAWLYDLLISLLLQAVAQVSLFKYLFYCKPSHKSKLKLHLN